jgi:hypothetical protein
MPLSFETFCNTLQSNLGFPVMHGPVSSSMSACSLCKATDVAKTIWKYYYLGLEEKGRAEYSWSNCHLCWKTFCSGEQAHCDNSNRLVGAFQAFGRLEFECTGCGV